LKDNFIEQIESSLNSADYSLFTRRCLDLSGDYHLSPDIKSEIFELRRLYLLANENTPLDDVKLTIEGKTLIEKLRSREFELANVSQHHSDIVFQAHNISKQFHHGRNPFKLHPISFALKLGEITGVVGENGNGKTTLLRMVAGQLSIDSGEIIYPALGAASNDYYKAKNRFAFIPQRIPKWHGTLMENLKFFATIHDIKGENNLNQIEYILFRLGLDKFRDLTWNQISSGYRMRFELAKMLLWRPNLLILDEPLANLDINAQQLFLQDLRFFTQSKSYPMSIILSSQALHEIERIADNIIFIRQGKPVYNGRQIDFGNDRQLNSFEVAGAFTMQQLRDCLANLNDCRVEDAGTAYIVTCDVKNEWFEIVALIKKAGLELNYFRNISQSTRQLFHKDI